ncbi:MAG: AAA family ATPase, partial [Hyphomicrobium sp.]
MKIDALRVAAFRRFSDPVAIEDFTDGINVLAGPNEMGKSTFFHALESAFVVRHKVSGNVLDAMRPFAGGEPLVEADFTVDGNRWRIRKQFGRGNAAILMDIAAGRVVARNAEAEDQLGRLIGRAGDSLGPIGLVWVKQQRTLHAPDPDIDHMSGKEKPRGERNALLEAIGREVESAAGGEGLERVRELTDAALDLYLTPTRNAAKKNGPLDMARRQRDESRAALDLAESAAAAAEQRWQVIAASTSELAALA